MSRLTPIRGLIIPSISYLLSPLNLQVAMVLGRWVDALDLGHPLGLVLAPFGFGYGHPDPAGHLTNVVATLLKPLLAVSSPKGPKYLTIGYLRFRY